MSAEKSTTSQDELNLREFLLFEFVNADGSSKPTKEIDFSPRDWVHYDLIQNALMVKFMPPPYDEESSTLLNSYIECKASPPEDWPSYNISLKGHAATYEEAQARLKRLEKRKYAYTTGADTDGEEKSIDFTTKIRCKKTKGLSESTKCALNVPDLDGTISNKRRRGNDSDSDESIYGESSFLQSSNLSTFETITLERQKPTTSTNSALKEQAVKVAPSYRNRLIKQSACKTPKDSLAVDSQNHNTRPPGKHFDTIKKPSNNTVKQKIDSLDFDSQKVNTKPQAKHIETIKKPPNNTVDQKIDQILKLIIGTHANVVEIAENQRVLMAKMNSQKVKELQNTVDFVTENGLNLPFKWLNEFLEFDSKLQTDLQFRKAFISSLHFQHDAKLNTRKTIVNILQKYISKELALQFTAVKQIPGKRIFKGTTMCSCMLADITQSHRDTLTAKLLSEKTFFMDLGAVLPNVKDWYGGRSERARDKNSNLTSLTSTDED